MRDKGNDLQESVIASSELIESEENLISSEGDETLGQVKYYLHGTSSLLDVEGIREMGLSAREGRATLSTDLEHACKWATGENRQYSDSQTSRAADATGRIFVFSKPADLTVDYGLHTDAQIAGQEITGFPIKYAAGRKQLALFQLASNKADLKQVKKEQREVVTLPPECIKAVIEPSPEVKALAGHLSRQVKQLEKVNITQVAKQLETLLANDPKNVISGSAAEISRSLVITTIESIVISKLRNLRLGVLSMKGYKILENGVAQSQQRDPEKLCREVAEMYEHSHQDGFDIGVAWLNRRIAAETELLSKEVE